MASNSKTEIILMIAENFGAQATERIIYLWLNLLEEYPLPVCQKAALNLIRNMETSSKVAFNSMPPFALMQKEIDAITGRITDSKERLESKAESAWDKLLEAIETYGAYQQPEGFDQTMKYCIRSLGGWSVICNWREADMNWRKKEFLELYALADGKVEFLEAGPQAIEAFSTGKLSIAMSDTKQALSDFMDSLKERGMKAIANG